MSSLDEPFGRQPLPVVVTITGIDPRDVDVWLHHLVRAAEFKGDMATPLKGSITQQDKYQTGFTIYPRAVND